MGEQNFEKPKLNKIENAPTELPPVAPGYVRLWRGEVPGGETGFSGEPSYRGRWFTESEKKARNYMPTTREGHLTYIDVPESLANASRASDIVPDYTIKSDYILPEEWAEQARPDIRKITPPRPPKPESWDDALTTIFKERDLREWKERYETRNEDKTKLSDESTNLTEK